MISMISLQDFISVFSLVDCKHPTRVTIQLVTVVGKRKKDPAWLLSVTIRDYICPLLERLFGNVLWQQPFEMAPKTSSMHPVARVHI